MIRLVVNPESQALTRQFDQPVVIIGAGITAHSDLILQGESLQENHIKIFEEQGHWSIINVINDPFVTLNGLPFGKKRLKNHDLLQIGSTMIRFEKETPPVNDEIYQGVVADTQNQLPEILEKTLSSTKRHTPEIREHVSSKWESPEENTEFGIEELLKQVEQLGNKSHSVSFEIPDKEPNIAQEGAFSHPTAEEFKTTSIESREKSRSNIRPSLRDDYLRHLDDEHQQWTDPTKEDKSPSFLPSSILNWVFLLKILIGLLLIGGIISIIAYMWISDQTEEEEIKASRGVADVTMALTYAKIKNIKPQNQNWADPEFVKNNLNAVLANSYPSLASFDPNGQFNNTPYILRIYTSSDFSQFLVLAQPSPNLFSQWITLKSSIVVDSNSMEMRKITDLKALNRLLVNSNSLDGVNAVEISNLVRQGELIDLAHLVNKHENIGFSPPKALSLIRPGAENLIYNAPRYYPLGEDLMKKTLDLVENRDSHYESSLVQQEIQSLSKFSNLVLYSSEGLQAALQGQKALATVAPKEKFLVAYLKLNPAGLIIGSRLLMDDSSKETAINDKLYSLPAALSRNYEHDLAEKESPVELSESSPEKGEKDTPLYLQLTSLSNLRQQALEPISEEIGALLRKENQSDHPDFSAHLQKLIENYQQTNIQQLEKISKKLFKIYQDRSDVPLSQFLSLVKTAGLETAVNENLKNLQKGETSAYLTQEEVNAQLQKIQDSDSWESLHENVKNTAEMLKLDRLPDPDKLISYQNGTRAKVIQKLTQFLLSSDNGLPASAYQIENRPLLTQILKAAWINDADSLDFYHNEFDQREKASQRNSPTKDKEGDLLTPIPS